MSTLEEKHAEVKEMIGKYVDITDPDTKEGMSGFLAKVNEIKELKEQTGFIVMVDYGMGWFITDNTIVSVTDPPEGEKIFIP